ncbi:unnamed protein product, partial [Closterium sp. NIES-54]
LSTIQAADRIVVMAHGRIKEKLSLSLPDTPAMAEITLATLTQEQLDRLVRQLEDSALEIATLTAERDSARQQSTVNAPAPTIAPAQSEEPIEILSGTPTQHDSVGQRSGIATASSALFRPEPTSRSDDSIVGLHDERLFDANYLESDAAKIRYAVSLLRGPAMDWWRVIVTSPRAYKPPSQEDGPTGPAVTWSSFSETAQYSTWDAWCAGLRARFEPIAASISARQKLRTWRQLGSVQDYTSGFLALCEQVGYMHEAERVDRYVGGIKPDILNFNEILALAEKIDILRRSRPGGVEAPQNRAGVRVSEAGKRQQSVEDGPTTDETACSPNFTEPHRITVPIHAIDRARTNTEGFQVRVLPGYEFLGHVISEAGVEIDPKKLDTVKALHPPTNITELQSFLGFVNYVRRFVLDMARLTAPLPDLLRKGVAFAWGEKEHAAFSTLKNVLCSPPVLRIADPHRPFEVVTDASDIAIGAVLLQDFGNVYNPSHTNHESCTRPRRITRYTISKCLRSCMHSKSGAVT